MTVPMLVSARSAKIAASFGASADHYDDHAGLQRHVAERLARHLPPLRAPRVLELACGTGLLSRHLLARYPDGRFLLSDLAPAMIQRARENLEAFSGRDMRFAIIDAAKPPALAKFDLIATSMSLHWLDRPTDILRHLQTMLAPGGALVFAGLGPDCFAEWRESLACESLPSGLVPLAPLPGLFEQERISLAQGGLAFLHGLRAVGGLIPPKSYAPLSPGRLRRAIRRVDRDHGGAVTWHIVYGRLSPMESSDAASLSSPSTTPR